MNKLTLRLGSAWYPEQDGGRTIAEDLRLMKELGMNAARVGEFAWAKWEPREGEYQTDWMADVMDKALEHGIGIVLCTPTAASPTWMLRKYPDIGFVTETGFRYGPGGRQAADYTHPRFQQFSRDVTEAIARALGKHPALIGWQTDNEFMGHQKKSYSESAVAGWHAWLKKTYGTIDKLNEAWSTQIWSQHYDRFEDVPASLPLPTWAHNHSVHTQYRRYMNDAVVEFQRQQVEIIRKHSTAPITHNTEDSVDEWDLYQGLDFASVDLYSGGPPAAPILYRIDCMRAMIPGRRYWVMETNSEGKGAKGLFPPGWAANYALMTYAAGGEGLSYWPWRGNHAGMEIGGHSCLVYANGMKATGWEECVKTNALRQKLEPILAEYEPARADVAFVRSERNGHHYYSDRIAGLEPNFNFRAKLEAHYKTLEHLGVWRDVLYDQAQFGGYKVVVSPYLPYTTPHFLQQMKRHLEAGGVWIAGPYTGYLTEHHTLPLNGHLGELEKMLGIKTQYQVSVNGLPIKLADGSLTSARMQGTTFIPQEGDEVLGTYQDDRLNGAAWGVRREVGNGSVYIWGSEVEPEVSVRLYHQLLVREGIKAWPFHADIVRIPLAAAGGKTAWTLINVGEEAQTLELPGKGKDLLSGRMTTTVLKLEPQEHAIVAFDQPVHG